jgi:hypothetical protein
MPLIEELMVGRCRSEVVFQLGDNYLWTKYIAKFVDISHYKNFITLTSN